MITIKLEHVSKKFKKKTIIKEANAEFVNGNIYGIIGANGSGKSVLLQVICGLMKASNGQVLYNGKVVTKEISILPDCGVIINKPAFFEDLDAFHNLKLLAQLQKKVSDKDIQEVLKKVNLENDDKRVHDYSLGMLQRLGIAQAIMEHPSILILDEFTNALDEDGIQMIHNILREEKKKGTLIIVTSHNRYDIESLCDEVYKINHGELQYEEKN